jgi:hypothetical protein
LVTGLFSEASTAGEVTRPTLFFLFAFEISLYAPRTARFFAL